MLLLLLLQSAHDLLAHIVVVVALKARDRGHDDLLVDLLEEMQCNLLLNSGSSAPNISALVKPV